MQNNNKQDGFILVITLIFLSTTTFLLWFYLNKSSIYDYRLEYALRKQISDNMALSAFNIALDDITKTKKPYVSKELSIDNTTLKYTISSENAKLNINKLISKEGAVNKKQEKIFKNFISKNNLPFVDKDILYDWIDEDNIKRPKGAESNYYLTTNKHKSANQKLLSLGELTLLKNTPFTKDNISDIKDLITLTSDGRININYAPYKVLLALHKNITKKQAENIIRSRKKINGFKSLAEFKKLSGIKDADFKEIKTLISVENNYFLIYALGNYKNIKTEIEAVVLKASDKFKILKYREI